MTACLAPDADAPSRVCVIIVSYNSLEHWPRLRDSLDRQAHRLFDLIVVDNCSRTEQRLDPSGWPDNWRLIQLEKNLGFAAANNLAVEKTDAANIVLLNPDAFPEPDWLARLIAAAHSRPDVAAFGCTQMRFGANGVLDGVGDCYWAVGHPYRAGYGKRNEAPRSGEIFSACGAAVLYRRDIFLSAGGFDERFFSYMEDVDLGFRLRLFGYRTMQVPDAIVHHVGGASAGRRSAFKTYYSARNRVLTFVKNMPAPLFWLLLPGHAALNAAALFHAAFAGVFRETWRGVKDALSDMHGLFAARAAVQRRRRASTLCIAAMLTWSPLSVLQRRAKVITTP